MTMKHAILAGIAAVAVAATLTGTTLAADISGAGSTFIYPVFAKWADTYKTATGVGLNYQSIGSGGGIKQVEAKTVTFGATDKPLSDDELTKNGLVQFPMVMGGIVPIVNIDGIKPGDLVLDGKTLADLFLGKITSWDDPAIKALNPSLTLPTAPVVMPCARRRAEAPVTSARAVATVKNRRVLSMLSLGEKKCGGKPKSSGGISRGAREFCHRPATSFTPTVF